MSVNKEIRAAGLKAGLTNKQMNTMPLSAVVEKLPIQIQKDLGLGKFGDDKMTPKAYGGKIKKKMMGGMVKKKKLSPGGRATSDRGYGGKSTSDRDSEGGRALSDADKKFIAKIKKQIAKGETGKAISDGDQTKFKRLQKIMAGGKSKSDRDQDVKNFSKVMDTYSNGGNIKKTYAMGGGMRKANYK
tara:strand:+ start:48 stop:608 length:561 start_codon:yes stop_codon:yes gene_type:complete